MNHTSMAACAMCLLMAACGQSVTPSHPAESFVRPPQVAPSRDGLVFGREQMVHFYDVPGEYGYVVEGRDHGFAGLSIITTDTYPGGGPPLHSHDKEEAHVILRGRYRVLIGEQQFDVTGPAVVRIPPGVPHTFVNIGEEVLHLVGVLPADAIGYVELGPNPLLAGAGRGANSGQ